MIPYVPQHALVAGRYYLTDFQIMLIVAVVAGVWIFHRRTRDAGWPRRERWGFVLFVVSAGFAGANLWKMFSVFSWAVLQNPVYVFARRPGLASMGGFAGGLLGALVFSVFRGYSRQQFFTLLDALAYAAPFACCLGRAGCFLAHDHRGIATTSWIGVQFPEGTAYDLALVELLFLGPLCVVFWWLGSRQQPLGMFFGLFGCLYGAFRIGIGSLNYGSHFDAPAMMMAVSVVVWAFSPRARA